VLNPETWQKVLEEEGFKAVFFPTEESHKLGQQIIVAASDGVIRQVKKQDTNLLRERTASQSVLAHKTEPGNALLKEKGIDYLKRKISRILKMPMQKIVADEQLEKYGIDSILVVQLTNELGKDFENISSTMFFEFQTIGAIVSHLIETQKETLVKLFEVKDDQPELIPDEVSLLQSRRSSYRFKQSVIQNKEVETRIQDIAIIGLAGRYPEARNMKEFWENLKHGRNCISQIPKDRWDWQKYYDEEKGKEGKYYSKWGGFIQDIDRFDPLFFHISPREAEKMDPQERVFLETAYATIQDAGYQPKTLCESKKVGVFVGVMNHDYSSSTTYWSIANRISYLMDFYGPSMAVDTACSSSLTAIHLALESMYSGTSDCALVGGVNLILKPNHYVDLSSMTMLSTGDQCKAFGENADGFVDGEGVGAILLKPLNKAKKDGDHIYGVIKGSMVNAGGKTNGYTVPNPKAQAGVVLDAYKRANVDPKSISYVEAHGTGTDLGDPIEIAGLSKAFSQLTKEKAPEKQYCYIGSVKSNIGHAESAAGIAGLTKILLQLKHQQIVPSLHSKELNPNINFTESPFIVNQALREWERPKITENGEEREYPRIAGISSFGAGGANAHIIIEEYNKREEVNEALITVNTQNPVIVLLSAQSKEQVKKQAENLLKDIKENDYEDKDLANISYTLQVGREAMEERMGVIVGSIKELKKKLKGYLEDKEDTEDLYEGQVKKNKEALDVLKSDEELQKITHSWIEKKKYRKLLDLWVKGLELDWNLLYLEGIKPRRMSLPTYPFAKERYWAEDNHLLKEKPDDNSGDFDQDLYDKLINKIIDDEINIEEAMLRI